MLWIRLWVSEPCYQHQNAFKRRYQTLKRMTNRLMDRTSTPPKLWFLALNYCRRGLGLGGRADVENGHFLFVLLYVLKTRDSTY